MHSSPLLNPVASPITINPCSEEFRRCFFTNGFPSSSRRKNIAFAAQPSPPPLTRQRNFRSSAQDGSNVVSGGQKGQAEGGGGEEDLQLVTAVRSQYNHIAIVDTPSARVLLLDSTHSVHSILHKDQKWTDSYWDEFASLPPIVPEGPISILGLGGGTAAHLMLDLWPSLQLEGWEIDEILIDKARIFFGLSELEKKTPAGGCLHVCIGDALQSTENDHGKYAGIIVDLFNEGKVLPELEQVSTWLELKRRLMANGRIMVNCAGIHGTSDMVDRRNHLEGKWGEHAVIKAMHEAFPGEQLSWKMMQDEKGANYLALTGPLPDLSWWSGMVPDELSESVKQWRACNFAGPNRP
ncbi:Probable polyamine aminopropyl transferase [Linum grandiflorum]